MVRKSLSKMLSNAPFPSSLPDLIYIIEILNESVHNCRQIYCSNPKDSEFDATDTPEPQIISVVIPLGVLLGENAERMCTFVLFLLNQLDCHTLWYGYGIELSGQPRGVDTTVNIRFKNVLLFSQDPYLLGKLSAFNKETPQKAAPVTHQFWQKATNHLNTLTSVRARAHITECYTEIDLLKAEVADMKRDKAVINALLAAAKTKIRSINRQGLIYESSKRDVSTMKSKRTIANAYETPSDKDCDRNNQRQIHNTVASAIGVVHKQYPNASHEACSLIISGIAKEFLPDHNDSEENNDALIQIAKNFIPVWRIIHAMVTKHHCDEHMRVLHQVLLMFVVGAPKEKYSACSIKSVMSKLGINDSKSRLVAAVANTRKNLFVLIEDKGGVDMVVDNVGIYVTELQPFFKGIARAENKNAISPEKIARIIESYYRNSEASPKKDDVVKHRIENLDLTKNTEYIYKQKRFATATEKETRLDHMNLYQEHVSVGVFSEHKPFEIYPATVNTCKCQTCEGNRLLKVAIIKQTKKINEPVHLFVDVYLVLLRFKRSMLLLKKIREKKEDSKVTLKTMKCSLLCVQYGLEKIQTTTIQNKFIKIKLAKPDRNGF